MSVWKVLVVSLVGCVTSLNILNVPKHEAESDHLLLIKSNIVILCLYLQSGKFGNAPSDAQENQPQGIQYAEDAAEHENMKAVLKSSLQGGESGTSTVPGLRTRTRASSTKGQSHKHVIL